MDRAKVFYLLSTLVVFFILSLYFFHPIVIDITNSDLGRHLLLGKVIVETKSVPTINLLSYSNSTYPFINSHWLSEVFFYLWQNLLGFNGLIILSVLLIVLSLALVFLSASQKAYIYAPIMLGLLYTQVLSERTEIRPELFSFLFLSIFIFILYKYKERYTKWIFALIPLELLWINFHIYFFIGIAVLFLFLADALIVEKDKLASKKLITLFLVALGAGVATLINPNFIKGAFYPLFVLNNSGFPVQENLNFFTASSLYRDPSFLYFGISVIVLWLSVFLAIKKMTPIDILLSIFFTFMGIFAVRNFPLFVFGTFIPLSKAVSYIIPKLLRRFSLNQEKIVFLHIMVFIIVLLLFVPIIIVNINNHGFGFGLIDNTHNGVEFLIKNNVKGPIYNNFDIGNYLDYKLYPKEKVFVDGRPDAYPKEFFQNVYFPMQLSQATFQQQSEKYHFSVIFFAHTEVSGGVDQFLYQLVRNNDWKMVYLDSSIVIFLENNLPNQEIIQAKAITQDNVIVSKSDYNDKSKVRQLANFFRAVKWINPQLTMNIRYLDLDPKNCVVIKNIVSLLQQQNSPDASIYINKYSQICQY